MRMRVSDGARRTVGGFVAAITAGSGLVLVGANPALATPGCVDGTTPALLSTVECMAAGNYTLTVPAGTTDVDVDLFGGGGGAGYPARSHIGGNAAEVSGNLTLPAGTAYLYVRVGAGGGGNNHGYGYGGGGSGVFALDSGHNLIAKLAIAGAGGGGAFSGDGGNAGSAGNSENPSLAGPGQPATGASGGAGGTGNYTSGVAGGSNNPSALSLATGGAGGTYPNNSAGGTGGGGYGAGGGGAVGNQGILNIYEAGGGGGSSLASGYLSAASISVAPNTGGVQLPGLVAGDGATGSVTMTFNGLAVPAVPTGVTATAGNGQASVAFTAPSDNGSPITSYTVTSSPGGLTASCPGSPCVVPGLTNGTAYTFTVHATNANGDSAESSASSSVSPATNPGNPTGVSATAGDGQASVAFTAPASDGGSAVTSYTVTSSPGGHTATCPGSPCVVPGLDNGTAYTFAVKATNGIGDSVSSAASDAVTPVGAPAAVESPTLTPGDGQIGVSFPVPGNGGSPITGYQYSTNGGLLWATLNTSTVDGVVSGAITGLINGVTYPVELRAVNAQGSGDASEAQSAKPSRTADAPTGVTATRGDGQASVSFTAPASDGGSPITSYTVTSSPGGHTATCPGSPCIVPGLDNGTAYTFAVTATNAVGDSVSSAASDAVTPAGTPAAVDSPTLTPGDGQIGVSFEVPADNGSPITGYQYSTDGGLTWSTLDASVLNGTAAGTIGDLTNGTSYDVLVRSVNDTGPGGASTVQAVTPVRVADAPTGVSATAGDGQASVSFTAPANDGGSPVTSYTVTSSPGGHTASCSGSPCVVPGLDNGTAYTFTVTATNAVGDSSSSAASDAVTPVGDPAGVSSPTLTPADGAIHVSFPAPADGGTPITGYEVTTDGGSTWSPLVGTTVGGVVNGVVSGLTNGSSYDVQVRALNLHGTGPASTVQSVAPSTVPAAPTGISAVRGAGSALVSFDAPENFGGSPVTGYTVTSSPGGLTGTCSASPCTVSGLTNGTAYTFTVHATNARGNSAESTSSSAVTPAAAPGIPGTVSALAGSGSAAVSFLPAASNGTAVTGYEYSLDNGINWSPLVTGPASGGRLVGTISGLTNGTVYAVSVRAVNAVGSSTASAPVSVTPTAVVLTPIQTKYAALGAGSSFLGAPLGGEYDVAGGRGQNYQHGRIFWSRRTGAWSVKGSIMDHYLAMGGPAGLLGFPTSDETVTPGVAAGRFNTFAGADGASIYWSPATGARSVHGAIRAKYLAMGGPSFLGFPTTDENATAANTGRYNHFSGAYGASIFWTPRGGAWGVYGAIRAQWIALGAERGRLGYPTSDEFAAGNARRNNFAGGYVTWNGRVAVTYNR